MTMDNDPTKPDHYKLPVEVHAALLAYLGSRPHREVEQAVTILRSLEAVPPAGKSDTEA